MNDLDSVVCKPTPWFLFRVLVMLLMFSIFAVLFYLDGSTGYRKKNEVFYLYQTFQQAHAEFIRMNADGLLTSDAWHRYAETQTVGFPKDPALLPATLKLPMPWPDLLHDYQRMMPQQVMPLWREFTKQNGMNAIPPDAPHDARQIQEQWIVCWGCLALASTAAFFLLRTLGRSIAADDQGVLTPRGRRVPYAELKTLDLRKWETKGLAFLDYNGPSGKGRIRIDGLTYGGFKPENDEPAERLMRLIRSRFAGELIEYAPLAVEAPPAGNEAESS